MTRIYRRHFLQGAAAGDADYSGYPLHPTRKLGHFYLNPRQRSRFCAASVAIQDILLVTGTVHGIRVNP
jgi:hypothetical protein